MAGLTAERRVAIPALRASWLQAAFVHWPVPPAVVQALLPTGLVPDVHEGSAWLTLTPHVMADMRPLGLPLLPDLGRVSRHALPDLSSTPEMNFRTYVRGPDGGDGLWFFSLDVAHAGVAAAVRGLVGAPYFPAQLTVFRGEDGLRYAGSRVGSAVRFDMTIRPEDPIDPSPLDVWLTGRWNAYTRHCGRLIVTPVEHEPWPLRSATVANCSENLTVSADLPAIEDALVHYSDGVTKVRVGLPRILR